MHPTDSELSPHLDDNANLYHIMVDTTWSPTRTNVKIIHHKLNVLFIPTGLILKCLKEHFRKQVTVLTC